METTITLNLPEDTARVLLTLISESMDTDSIEWDNHMKLIFKQLREKI